MQKNYRTIALRLLACLFIASGAGCAVPQPRGGGTEMQVKEDSHNAYYYLYLPEAYVKNNGVYPGNPNKKWPLVVTFHGMKPYDSWDRQIHEWQQEADTYGYIVCAPYLYSCDGIFMEFPLTKEHSYVLRDKENIMACIDHVMATTRADPRCVLSTGWSSGGFFAHYIPNHYPDRFRCIATRLCNFSPQIMTEASVPAYRNTPVAVYMGDSDFNSCVGQSQQAIAWYKARNFRTVESKMIDGMGHRRIPQTAAAFFAKQIGVEPLRPETAAKTLAQLRMTDYEVDPTLIASLAPEQPLVGTLASANQPSQPAYAPPVVRPQQPRTELAMNTNRPIAANPQRGTMGNKSFDTGPRMADTAPSKPTTDAGKPRGTPPVNRPRSTGPQDYPVDRLGNHSVIMADRGASPRVPAPTPVAEPRTSRNVNIRINGPTTGPGPLYVAFSTDLPSNLLPGSDFLWTHNGNPICDTARGVRIFDQAGTHRLAVLIITRDGHEYRGSASITVRGRTEASTVRATSSTDRNLFP